MKRVIIFHHPGIFFVFICLVIANTAAYRIRSSAGSVSVVGVVVSHSSSSGSSSGATQHSRGSLAPCLESRKCLQTRGGGEEDDEATALTTTKTAVSVGVGLFAISLIAKLVKGMMGQSESDNTDSSTRSIKDVKPISETPPPPRPNNPPPPPPPPREVESNPLDIMANKTPETTNAPAISNYSVMIRTFFSVVLTTAGLMAILYGAQTETVTEFCAALGLPEQIAGVAPIMYVTFWFLTFAASAVTDLISGGVSAAFQQALRPNDTPSGEWYATVKKPSWNPPCWVFAVMWLLVSKPTQFLALRQMFLSPSVTEAVTTTATTAANVVAADLAENISEAAATAASVGTSSTTAVASVAPSWILLGFYCLHLALGNAWNDVFFGYQKIGLGLAVIILFWATLGVTSALFYQENKASRSGLLI